MHLLNEVFGKDGHHRERIFQRRPIRVTFGTGAGSFLTAPPSPSFS